MGEYSGERKRSRKGSSVKKNGIRTRGRERGEDGEGRRRKNRRGREEKRR